MTKKQLDLLVAVPDGINVTVEGLTVTVTGEKGADSRTFSGNAEILEKDGNVVITPASKRKKDRAVAGAVRSHIRNLITGARDGVTYKLKIVYSHFPMNVKVQGSKLVIDNFLGEKHPRQATIIDGASVEVKGQDVTVTGMNKEKVAQTAANFEQATRIKNLDPRVFQDGIYITDKDGRHLIRE